MAASTDSGVSRRGGTNAAPYFVNFRGQYSALPRSWGVIYPVGGTAIDFGEVQGVSGRDIEAGLSIGVGGVTIITGGDKVRDVVSDSTGDTPSESAAPLLLLGVHGEGGGATMGIEGAKPRPGCKRAECTDRRSFRAVDGVI